MKDLVVKFWRIGNAVSMKVLEQDENTRGNGVLHRNGRWELASVEAPELPLEFDIICVRGTDKSRDGRVCCRNFGSVEGAKEFLSTVSDLIVSYNDSQRDKASLETVDPEVEIWIAR